ncbi:hypothetical protein SPACI_024530 [Sporomusa acidovorans DSM 3132]|uniref:Uncharacterized protein n=3 Tax=Sporomusa TaxID=2375 RepID=A0ABZ3J3D1_SPOA4|nr:hypothetical protein SPACI_00190 [Sporomusa acidovorans DSM 3132]SDF76618.1 hypothetical protein SAMN04488499_107914 [Sporomusa acidovorans]
MGFLMDEFEKKTYEHRELELMRMTELALNTINPIIQKYNQGFSSKEDTSYRIQSTDEGN